MYIRKVKKQRSSQSKIFYQYTLAQSARVDGKVKQRAILYLGSDPLLENKDNQKIVLRILKAKIFRQPDLFPIEPPKELLDLALYYYEKYCIKYEQSEKPTHSIPPAPDKAEYHNIDIKGLELNDVKSFGAEHLCKQVIDKLKLRECFSSVGMTDKQIQKALISISARAIFSSSEHKTAQILETNSELPQLFSYDNKITHKQLYTISDILYKHKEQIDSFLYKRVTNMFDLEDRLVIFDISNTYFSRRDVRMDSFGGFPESRKDGSKIAKHGRSKEKRGDCPLVVFTGVINAEGFIKHSRIYEGNKPDNATLSDMIDDLKKHVSPTSNYTIVMDAGIATEDNLTLINKKGYKYVAVSRKRLSEWIPMGKDYPIDASKPKIIQLTNRKKEKVELAIFRPDGFSDTWMYVQSDAKRKKEESMNKKLKERFEEDLLVISKALKSKGGIKLINKVWERIGRAKQKHNRVSARYDILVTEKDGKATELKFLKKKQPVNDDKEKGVYFIRTNYKNTNACIGLSRNEKELWNIYNTIREVEATFRCLKSDLNIRPVHYQKDHRIETHIYLTILAYQLVNTIRHMLKLENINHDWKNIVRIISTQTIQTVVLPTDKKVIHLRQPSKPIKEAKQIYDAAKCINTQKPIKKYVVYH